MDKPQACHTSFCQPGPRTHAASGGNSPSGCLIMPPNSGGPANGGTRQGLGLPVVKSCWVHSQDPWPQFPHMEDGTHRRLITLVVPLERHVENLGGAGLSAGSHTGQRLCSTQDPGPDPASLSASSPVASLGGPAPRQWGSQPGWASPGGTAGAGSRPPQQARALADTTTVPPPTINRTLSDQTGSKFYKEKPAQ